MLLVRVFPSVFECVVVFVYVITGVVLVVIVIIPSLVEIVSVIAEIYLKKTEKWIGGTVCITVQLAARLA